jgi:hypothetical protein
MAAFRPLAVPRPARVETDRHGAPRALLLGPRRLAVTTIRDDWLVQDRWWTDRPVERRYYELVLESGRLATVYHDRLAGEWLIHP